MDLLVGSRDPADTQETGIPEERRWVPALFEKDARAVITSFMGRPHPGVPQHHLL